MSSLPKAPLSPANTHASLKRYVDEVVLCFDGDKAGRAAAIRALDDLIASGLAIRVASIPPPEDPDSYLKKFGVDAFRRILTNAQGFFEFLLQHLVEVNESGTDKGRVAIVRAMGEALAKTGNSVLMDTHAQRTAQRLGVSAEAVRMEFRKAGNRATDTTVPEVARPPAAAPETRPGTAEFWLIKFLLQADHDLLVWASPTLGFKLGHPSHRATDHPSPILGHDAGRSQGHRPHVEESGRR
jgi:DNA primase